MDKSNFQKMLDGELYNPYDDELAEKHALAQSFVEKFNHTAFKDSSGRGSLLKKLCGEIGKNVEVKKPFYCDYGVNIYLKDNVFINYDCIFLDCNKITIGINTVVGPRVQFYTAVHPLDVEKRNSGLESSKEICIGNNVWIGGGAIICPGVSIGAGSTIGAGSVVVTDIPENVVAAGNPCKVIRSL